MAGVRLSKDQVNDRIGQALLDVNVALNKVQALKGDFLHLSDEELGEGVGGLGFTAGEITLIRGAFDDMDDLFKIYRGAMTLPAERNFRARARKLWGLGS